MEFLIFLFIFLSIIGFYKALPDIIKNYQENKKEEKKLSEKNKIKEGREYQEALIKEETGKRNLRVYTANLRNNTRLISGKKEDYQYDNKLLMSIDSDIDSILNDELINENNLDDNTFQDELADIIDGLHAKKLSNDPVTKRLKSRLVKEKRTEDATNGGKAFNNDKNSTENTSKKKNDKIIKRYTDLIDKSKLGVQAKLNSKAGDLDNRHVDDELANDALLNKYSAILVKVKQKVKNYMEQ